MAMLFVYHVTPPEIESDDDNTEDDTNDLDDEDCSDEEFIEIKRKSRTDKQ